MRILEIIIVLILGLIYLYTILKRENRHQISVLVPVGLLLLLLLHVFLEGSRWQMMVPYFTVGIIGLNFLYRRFKKNPNPSKTWLPLIGSWPLSLQSLFICLLLGLSLFMGFNPPIKRLPPPTGPYPIGITQFHFVDKERKELATADPNDRRSLWGLIWYPAGSIDQSKLAPILPESQHFMPQTMQGYGLPSFTASHFDLIKSHAYEEAPIQPGKEKFPLLIYSHGYLGFPGNAPEIEALASHGYVVVSIAHTYETKLGKTQDGSGLLLKTPIRLIYLIKLSLAIPCGFNILPTFNSP